MKTKKIIFMGLMITLNIVFGTVVSYFKIPYLYLDTVGTIFTAAIFGPIAAIIVGLSTNLVLVIPTGSAITAVFGLVNATIGLICGLGFKKFGVNLLSAILLGFVCAFIAPLIGTPIAMFFYGGLDFDASDFLKLYIDKVVENFALSVYYGKVVNNLIDKIASTVIVYLVIRNTDILGIFANE